MNAETMFIPAIPNFIKEFDISYGMSSWVLTSYLIARAVTTPIAGSLSANTAKKGITSYNNNICYRNLYGRILY